MLMNSTLLIFVKFFEHGEEQHAIFKNNYRMNFCYENLIFLEASIVESEIHFLGKNFHSYILEYSGQKILSKHKAPCSFKEL